MFAIYKRDLASYFHTVIGQLVTAYITGLLLVFFMFYNVAGGYPTLESTISFTAMYGLTLGLPLLCMRSFSEDKRTKTDQLYMTAPVTIRQIVLGKYFAVLTVFAIPCLVACAFPLILRAYGTISLSGAYLSILAFFLYGAMIIAICMFISSLTENQIISVVISFGIIMIGMLLSALYDRISITWLKNLLNNTLDFNGRLSATIGNTFDLTSVIYFITVAALFLFFTEQVLQKRRFSVSKKNAGISAYNTAMIAIVTVAVVFLNLISAQIPDNIREYDTTTNGLNSITQESKDIAAAITDDITFVFAADEDADYTNYTYASEIKAVFNILNEYCKTNDHLQVEYVDPVTDPTSISKYMDDADGSQSAQDLSLSIVVRDDTNGRYKYLSINDLFEFTTNYYTYSSTLSAYDIEGQLTSALQYVTLDDSELMQVYFLTGQNETSLESTYTDVLSKYNMTSDDLDLTTLTEVPEDCDLLIVNQPMMDLNDSDLEKLTAYAENGGEILLNINTLMLEQYAEQNGGDVDTAYANWQKLADVFGVTLESGVVVETDSSRYIPVTGYEGLYMLPYLTDDDITSGISDSANGYVLSYLSGAVSYGEDTDTLTYQPILQSSDMAYLKKDLSTLGTITGEDVISTYTVGLRADLIGEDDTVSTLVVYTSPYLFMGQTDQTVGGNNLKLFANTLNALSTFDVDMVTIPSKSVDTTLTIPAKVFTLLFYISIAVVLALIIDGIAVWAIRRKK